MRIDEEEMKAQREYIEKWAAKKMLRHAKKLQYYTKILFGEQATVLYSRGVIKVIGRGGNVSEIIIPEKEKRRK